MQILPSHADSLHGLNSGIYVSPARACYGAVCAECALAGAASVHLHLIIPSPHSGLQLERESHRHDSYPQVSRGMGASSTLDIIILCRKVVTKLS